MTERYVGIVVECLAHEDKSHRDAVLARYPDQAPGARHLMDGIAQRLSAWVRHAGANGKGRNREPYTKEERRQLRNERLETIEPPWLRDRVETMVREQHQYVKEQRRKLQEAIQ